MLNKIRKISKIYKKRRVLKAHLNSLLHEEKLDSILKHFNILKLPEITVSDLLEHYSYKEKNNITIKTDFSGGISPVNDYYFLCLIAKANKVKKYFEFGTWVGLSSYNMSLNLGHAAEIYSLDIPDSHPEIAEFQIPKKIFGHYSKNIKNIHFLKSDSKDFDPGPYRKQFDMVFVDGNHSYEYVKNDTKISLELLKDDNSVIAWHDYMLGGELNKNVLSGILNGIPESEHKHIYGIYQSNLAVYSKKFEFGKREIDKWEIPEVKFNVSFDSTLS